MSFGSWFVKTNATYNPTWWGLYALGGGINELTGGHTATYWAPAAARGAARGTTYSNTTQALSGYQGSTPGAGDWGLPIVNRATFRVAGDVLKAATEDVLGIDLKTLLLAGGVLAAVALAPRK